MSAEINLDFENKWYIDGKKVIAGTDEAGRGPLAGPVVAAAVIFKKGIAPEGLNDSKKLSAKKREYLYDLIIRECLCYAISVVDNQEIDRINILRASLLAMKNSVDALKIKPDIVLVDGKFIFETDIEAEAVVKGDSKSISIAAASILAKVYRDRIMFNYDKIYPQYGFAAHKGYPTKAHYEALAKYGTCEIHRGSFKLGIG